MALKIIRSNEPITVNNVVVTIYGNPSSGKTSLAYTAQDVLLLDFDRGSFRAHNRQGDTVQVEKWADVVGITADDLKPYKTLVIDTVGNMINSIIAHIELTNPSKAKNTMLLYGEVAKVYKGFVTKIKSCGMDLVFIAHYAEDKKGDQIITRIDAGGKARNDVYQSSDLLGYLEYSDGTRILNFNPVDGKIAKNTGNFAPIDLTKTPVDLADIIEQLKHKINSLSEEALAKQQAYDNTINLIDNAETIEQFTELMTNEVVAADKQGALKKRLVAKAKERGIDFDTKQKCFVVVKNEQQA